MGYFPIKLNTIKSLKDMVFITYYKTNPTNCGNLNYAIVSAETASASQNENPDHSDEPDASLA